MVRSAKRRSDVIEWLNSLFPTLRMPVDASEEELRARLLDGSLLFGILRRSDPGYSNEVCSSNFRGTHYIPFPIPNFQAPFLQMRNDDYDSTPENSSENITKFISAVENMGLPGFDVSDLEQVVQSNNFR